MIPQLFKMDLQLLSKIWSQVWVGSTEFERVQSKECSEINIGRIQWLSSLERGSWVDKRIPVRAVVAPVQMEEYACAIATPAQVYLPSKVRGQYCPFGVHVSTCLS